MRISMQTRPGNAVLRQLCLAAALGCIPLAQPAWAAEALPYSEAVATRFPPPLVRYDTPGLAPGREQFTSNAELRDAMRELVLRPGGPRLITAGASHEGWPIEALLFSHRADRPVVLLVGQQHGNEPAGSEALLALAQQLAVGPLSAVLEKVDVLVLPRANPDGAARATRAGGHGLDINRDHLWLRTAEARALARLAQAYAPVLVVDVHEYTAIGSMAAKFGGLHRHDLLFQYAMTANHAPELQRASEDWFRKPLLRALEREGISSDWYYTNTAQRDDLSLAMGGIQPDTARNVYGLKHSVSILLESRGIGLGRLHLQRRVHSQVLALQSLLVSAAAFADELVALRTRVASQVSASACQGEMVVLAAQTPSLRQLLLLDPLSGADKSVNLAWLSSLQLNPVIERARPCGYWLAAEAADAAQRLAALGLALWPLAQAADWAGEVWKELGADEAASSAAAAGPAGEATPARSVQVVTEKVRLAVPAGGWYVPLDQPLANLAVAALEPDTPYSYFSQGWVPRLAAVARVMQRPR